jgi:hypothetical protein
MLDRSVDPSGRRVIVRADDVRLVAEEEEAAR